MALTKVSGDFIQDGSITQSHLHASHGITTSDIGEGSNLYFTTARVDSRIGDLSTSDLSEGTNLYYTDARVDARIALQVGSNLDLSSKSTSDLSEGTNLYYTQARFNTAFAAKSTSDLSEGTNLYYTDARADARIAAASTSDLSEGTNLYYTDARVGSYLTTNSYATQSYVNTQVSNLVDSAPSTLDTLNELAAALGDDANFSTTVTNSIATKLPLAGGTLTGALQAQPWLFRQMSNQVEYHVLDNGSLNGPSWKFRYDGATSNRWVDFGYKDGNGTYYEGLKLYNNSTITWKGNTMWHAGNDGSGSGLDADLLDGLHASSFLQSESDTLATVTARGASTSTAVTFAKATFNTSSTGLPRQITIKENGDTENSMGSYPGAWTSALNIQSNDGSTYLWFSPLTSNIPRIQTNYGQIDFYTGNNSNRALHLSGISARSEIFYDLNDTGYYLDPNATSNLSAVNIDGDTRIGGTTKFNIIPSGWTNADADQWPYLYWHRDTSNGWDEGLIKASSSRGFFSKAGWGIHMDSNRSFHIFSSGWTANFGVEHGGNAFANGQMRAPIFYDYNDTTYYIDPQSNTRLTGFVKIGNSSTYNSDDGNWGARLQVVSTVHARIDVGQDANAMRSTWYCHTGQSGSYFGATTGHDQYLMSHNTVRQYLYNGYSQEASSYRAPIFYDSDNTAYRADFTDTGNSIIAAGSYNAQNYNKPALLLNASGTGSSGAAFGMQQVTAEGWTGVFVDYEPYTGWGLYHDNPNNYFCVTAETSTGNIRSFTVPSRSSGNRTSYEKIRFDQNNGNIISGGSIYAASFIDQNNSAYYLDPNTTGTSLNAAGKILGSNINTSIKYLGTGVSYDTNRNLKVTDGIALYGAYNGGANSPHTYDFSAQFVGASRGFELSAAWHSQTALYIRTLRDCCQNWSSWYAIALHGLNPGTSAGALYAGAFYDSGNTGYYVDPASYSNLSSGRIGSYLQIGTTGNTTHTPGINMGIGSDIYWRQSTYSSNADVWMESVDNATYLQWKLRVSSFDTTSWTDSIVVFNHNFWRGYVGILRSPEYPLDLNGQARLSGGYTTSDVRLKRNIRDNELGLSHLLQLRTRLFDWITDEEILGRTLAFQNSLLDCRGFIAQEVEEVVPELVDTSEGDQPTKSIDDGAVTAMMVKAIQEQQAIIDDLKARIEILENQ